MFALRNAMLDEMAQQAPLVRFEALTLMTAGAIRAVSLRLDPTGRNPRHFDIGFADLEDGLEPGAMLLAGNRHGQAVVRVVAVDDDGQVHFTVLPGSVAKNQHRLHRTVA